MAIVKRRAAEFACVILCSVTFAAQAQAQQQPIALSPAGCQSYAAWSGNLVWASDLGADKEKARDDLVQRDQKTPSSIFALMLQNLDALWNTSAGWEDVTAMLLQDCIQRRGIYIRG